LVHLNASIAHHLANMESPHLGAYESLSFVEDKIEKI